MRRWTDTRGVAFVSLLTASMCVLAIVVGAQAPTGGVARQALPEPSQCNEQSPQPELIRSNYVPKRGTAEERRARRDVHLQSIRYRTARYGHFPGFGDKTLNPFPPSHYARTLRVFGLRVRLHERIIPAVECAAAAIHAECSATPYQPRRLSGMRDRNTYRGGEISNHVYGIALDIDPDRNTCCGCVPPWSEHPLCANRSGPIFTRMAMPECWVRQFERYGFYWLGNDVLEDTMHFEFLGDPDRIRRTAPVQ